MGVGVVMKSGKITATTAEASGGKNVECGFIPEYVRIWNEDATDGEHAILERFGGMAALQSIASFKFTVGTGTDNSYVDETTNGMSDYDATAIAAASSTLSGTSTPTGTAVAGTSTPLYLSEVAVGDEIQIGVERRRVTAIASNSALTVDIAFTVTAGDASTTLFAAGALVSTSGFKGFTIPANFIGDGDILRFVAWGTPFAA